MEDIEMRWKLSLAATFIGLVAAGAATAALAFDFGVTNAVSSGNLSVYLVRGADAAAAPLTLEQGLAGGFLKIHEGDKLPILAENVSSRSVFIQAGDMIKGGLQDQVAVFDYVIGPHSGRVPIETMCVDPFRSAARTGESATAFTAAGGLIPSRAAILALLAQPASDKVTQRLRQSAVWWSIDSLRTGLSQRLGHTLETPRHVTWDESQTDSAWARALQQAQRSPWKTSLPLALEDPGLARAERPYLESLLAAGQRSGVIGAVFAINGRLEGAEIYQSRALFRAMWPKLLHAYAIRALVAGPDEHAASPSVADVTAFLDAADAGQLRAEAPKDGARALESVPLVGMFLDPAAAPPEGLRVREAAGAIATETAGAKGGWVHRSYVAKLAGAEAAASPEAAFVTALDRGEIDGVRVAGLDPREPVVPHIAASRDASPSSAHDVSWRLALPEPQRMMKQALASAVRPTALSEGTAKLIQRIAEISSLIVAAVVAMLLLWAAEPLPRIAAGARRLAAFARRQWIAGWGRSAVARLGRIDHAAPMPANATAAMPAPAGAGVQMDGIVSLALRQSALRLADRRRLHRNGLALSRDVALRTPVGGRTTSDLAA
jgi:hypothetical protein